MTNIIDDGEEEQFEAAPIEEMEPVAEEQTAQEQQTETQQEPSEDDLPEKYRGKSAKEIARMHQEAERALGRQGSEVGELRRIVDEFVRNQSIKAKAPEPEEEIDFFADPKKAIEKAIEQHPKVREAELVAHNLKRVEAVARVKAEHPDFMEIIQTPEFQQWVGKSRVRQELLVRADQYYDADAATELLGSFKELRNTVKQAVAVEKNVRRDSVKQASTGAVKGSGESSSKKIYRRADIIELMQRDPARYQALQPEIMRAYAEKRVR